jgi:hypothetical protein
MAMADDAALRDKLENLLQQGLKTRSEERAYGDAAISAIVRELNSVRPDDHASKLIVAGFTNEPYVAGVDDIAQACETCMYYAVHRRFCDFPELRIPVQPQWSCRLWRI